MVNIAMMFFWIVQTLITSNITFLSSEAEIDNDNNETADEETVTQPDNNYITDNDECPETNVALIY